VLRREGFVSLSFFLSSTRIRPPRFAGDEMGAIDHATPLGLKGRYAMVIDWSLCASSVALFLDFK
jgi:hypothetical protein